MDGIKETKLPINLLFSPRLKNQIFGVLQLVPDPMFRRLFIGSLGYVSVHMKQLECQCPNARLLV